MGQPAAKKGDTIAAIDTHIVLIPSPGGPVATPLPHPFNGVLQEALSENVYVMGMPAATVGSVAKNTPPHIPQGGPFQKQPSDRGTIDRGSETVRINGKPVARSGDPAMTCNDPEDAVNGIVISSGKVLVG